MKPNNRRKKEKDNIKISESAPSSEHKWNEIEKKKKE